MQGTPSVNNRLSQFDSTTIKNINFLDNENGFGGGGGTPAVTDQQSLNSAGGLLSLRS
jgi:hypothetical protein